MTKRFTFMQDTLVKADVFDNGEFVCCTLSVWVEQLVGLLNELHEKNQDNKAMIEFLSTENTQMRSELKIRTQIQHQLEEENEQLKQEIDTLQEQIAHFDIGE